MKTNLSQMSNAELNAYLSKHRNNQQAFHAALEVLLSRRNPANRQPYPFDLTSPELEVEALLREKFHRDE
jgi:hypothetical protein